MHLSSPLIRLHNYSAVSANVKYLDRRHLPSDHVKNHKRRLGLPYIQAEDRKYLLYLCYVINPRVEFKDKGYPNNIPLKTMSSTFMMPEVYYQTHNKKGKIGIGRRCWVSDMLPHKKFRDNG